MGSTASSSHTYDVSKTLAKNGFTKDGCVFTGWNTAADGSGASYDDGVEVKSLTADSNGKVTLYAQWSVVADSPQADDSDVEEGSPADDPTADAEATIASQSDSDVVEDTSGSEGADGGTVEISADTPSFGAVLLNTLSRFTINCPCRHLPKRHHRHSSFPSSHSPQQAMRTQRQPRRCAALLG